MDGFAVSLEPRSFNALLNGLNKKLFFNHDYPEITHAYLAEKLYDAEIDPAQVAAEISLFEKVRCVTF